MKTVLVAGLMLAVVSRPMCAAALKMPDGNLDLGSDPNRQSQTQTDTLIARAFNSARQPQLEQMPWIEFSCQGKNSPDLSIHTKEMVVNYFPAGEGSDEEGWHDGHLLPITAYLLARRDGEWYIKQIRFGRSFTITISPDDEGYSAIFKGAPLREYKCHNTHLP